MEKNDYLIFLARIFIFLKWEIRTYEARVRFWIRMQVWNLAIFEKVGCGCGEVRQLKNYQKNLYLYFLSIFTIKIFLENTLDSQNKERRPETQNKKEMSYTLT